MIYLGITSVDFTAEWVARVVAKASRRCVQWQVHTIAASVGACYRRCHAEECGGCLLRDVGSISRCCVQGHVLCRRCFTWTWP